MVDLDEKVAQVKEKIYRIKDCPSNPLVLSLGGANELKNQQSLRDCGLVNHSKIIVFIKTN